MNESSSPEQLARLAQQKMLNRAGHKKPAKRATTMPISASATQQRGQAYEQRAVNYLQERGLNILMQNLESRYGEIDIVARSGEHLVFVEVRQRQHSSYGGAIYSVQADKQRRIKLTAHYFLPMLTRRYFNGILPFCRFDVIAIEGDQINWLTDAFM